MSGLTRMKKRASWDEYDISDSRIVSDKYKSFQYALKSSYQAEWITLDKGEKTERHYRCLINSSRLTEQFDKKVLSIDFDSGVDEGSVFWWDRTNRYWIVGLQQHTEEAYFRGIITRCDYTMDVNGKKYWISVRGPQEQSTVWNSKHGTIWNTLNYTMAIQITKDSNTVNFFSRHQIVKMRLAYPDVDSGEELEEWHNWRVVATDKYTEDSIIEVYLKEWYDNDAEDAMIAEDSIEDNLTEPHIIGPAAAAVFDTNVSFSVAGYKKGTFSISDDKKAKIISYNDNSCVIDILASKSSFVDLKFIAEDGSKLIKTIKIKPF